jgi:hypothetical protein
LDKEKKKEVLPIITPLPVILGGNRYMLAVISHGRKRF